MGFFPNIFKIPKGDIIPNIVTLGGYGVTKGSLKEGVKFGVPALKSLIAIGAGPPQSRMSPQIYQESGNFNQPPSSPYSQGPAYSQPLSQPYFGTGYAPDFAPIDTFTGGSPWGYSTPSMNYSRAPLVTYSAVPSAPENRVWEDLVTAGLTFLL